MSKVLIPFNFKRLTRWNGRFQFEQFFFVFIVGYNRIDKEWTCISDSVTFSPKYNRETVFVVVVVIVVVVAFADFMSKADIDIRIECVNIPGVDWNQG